MHRLNAILMAVLVLGACSEERQSIPRHNADESVQIDTSGIPQALRAADLDSLGFDPEMLQESERVLAALNTSLVALAALKRSYDATTDTALRARLNVAAMRYHITADRFLRDLLLTFPPPWDSVFNVYVQERKGVVGFEDWHLDHRQLRSTEVPGLLPPRRAQPK